jgi:hypothetical protein
MIDKKAAIRCSRMVWVSFNVRGLIMMGGTDTFKSDIKCRVALEGVKVSHIVGFLTM